MRVNVRHHGRARPSRRRGVLILAELLFVLPVLMMFFLGIAEYYMLTATRIDMLHASRAGARTAASGGFAYKQQTDEEVKKTVHAVLGTGRLSKNAHVKVIWSQDLPAEETFGQADWVEARVEVRARSVIPDVLGWLGFSLGNRELVSATRMKQE